MSRGIDYAGPGSTVNRDPDTGIRYGIVPLHKLHDEAVSDFDPVYVARCPHCGEDIPDDTFFTSENRPADKKHGMWARCPQENCGKLIEEDQQFGDEPDANRLDDGVYEANLASDNDVWVFKSPYYTRAAFCSPCAPGACYLTSPCEDGERAYCLGHDWFEGGEAPYPVYSVKDDTRVYAVVASATK